MDMFWTCFYGVYARKSVKRQDALDKSFHTRACAWTRFGLVFIQFMHKNLQSARVRQKRLIYTTVVFISAIA
jgi:hypothetical protein